MADIEKVSTNGSSANPSIFRTAIGVRHRIGEVVLGKHAQVNLVTAALLAGEHVLLSDVPGAGKTTLAASMARAIGGRFNRIQGNPDLLPTDMTGFFMHDPGRNEWVYRPGPLQANVVIVDELNRITPRTQSALLEAMAEHSITVDGKTLAVPEPFIVVATMNRMGSAGTFAVTGGQIDRFGISLAMGPLDRDIERRVLRGEGGYRIVDSIQPAIRAEQLVLVQQAVSEIFVSDLVLDYLMNLCDAMRGISHLSPRASQSMLALARAMAVLDGRQFVVPSDVKALSVPCLAHRLAGEGEPVEIHAPEVKSVTEDLPIPEPARR